MKKCILILFLLVGSFSHAQLFEMKKTYTGFHYAFSRFNEDGINKFVVQFNKMYETDIESGFQQYKGNERGQTFTTSGFRLIFGKKETKWTVSSDYAFGFGKDKNEVVFKNGMIQHMNMKFRNNQVNLSFGITKDENRVWLEALYCTNLGKIILEYSTEHRTGVTSFGTEYKLNGVYVGHIKTMEFGVQASYKYKKYVFYARALMPALIIGPSKKERAFVDERSSQTVPKDFPSDYNSFVNDPAGHTSRGEYLQSTGFKGFSYGFGMFYLIGKDK
ncbi:MAG: hypothetical protein ACHQF2_03775 [Flavobacteriales bacterium]